MERYPRLEVKLSSFENNAKEIVKRANEVGVDIAGVVKGAGGDIEVAKAYERSGAKWIASSRLGQLEKIKNAGVKIPALVVRISMLSEVEDVVRICDYSLQSELKVIEALNKEAEKQGKVHNVILMADMGDLREGFWDKDEMAEASLKIDKEMKNIHLAGIGTNVGCYGSVLPTKEKLEELVAVAEKIEAKLGRKLEIISGGATSSLMRLWDGDLPERVNQLRVGEGALLNRDLVEVYGYKMEGLVTDCFKIKAEVIEVKRKPTHPVGELGVDAFGHKMTYKDRGMRMRALLGMGKVDYGDLGELIPLEKGIELIGASSDHTIVDIEDAEKKYQVGDIMEFDVNYSTLVYMANSDDAKIVYK